MWSFGKWVVRSPFNDAGDPISSYPVALGYPRGFSSVGDFSAFEALAKWLQEIGVKCVAGPVLSGAQMAYAVAMASKGKIRAAYLPKDGYRPMKHYDGPSMCTPYAMIDDIVESGESLGVAIQIAIGETGEEPLAIVADGWHITEREESPLAKFSGRLWTVRLKEGS